MAEDVGNIGGLLTPREDFVPNLQSVYGDIIQNAADYQYFTAPLSNQGRTTATYGGQNNIVVAPDTPVRVVNNATGEVVYSGVGYEGAQGAIDAANALSASTGKKANWDIQVAGPTMQGFQSVSTDRPDTSALDVAAKVAGTALPIAVGFIPGFGQLATGLQIAAGAGAGAAGAGLRGDNILKGAIMGGLSSAGGTIVGDALRSGTNLGANAARAIGTGIGTTAGGVVTGQGLENALLSGVASGGLSYLGGEAFGKRGGTTTGDAGSIGSSGVELGDFVVTAGIPRFSGGVFTPSFGDRAQMGSDQADPYGTGIFSAGPTVDDSLLVTGSRGPTTGSIVGSSIANAATNAVNTSQPSTTKTDAVTRDEYGNVVDDTGAIVATAGGKAPTNLLPAALATGTAATAAAAANATGATTTAAEQAATRTGLTPEQTAALNAGATAGGVFGTGLSLAELATLGSLGASAVGSLFGGGSGGTGTGTPYVSPFGAGPAIGGADFRVNPNIKNYEEYGFGGEATFFRPEYNKLVSSGASMGGAPIGGTATTNTPTYTPLIGGATTGDTTTTGGATTGGATAITKQERPAGFTGVVSGQQVGDTQVVDGTTWSYGGDKAGWQMQYVNDAGQTALLPGNGATNVSSFANNPTVAVNQPYFAQNTANIPGWAETYQGFQRGLMSQGVTGDAKAAAERELFSAIETQPFANPQSLVDYARTVYNKYTTPGLI